VAEEFEAFFAPPDSTCNTANYDLDDDGNVQVWNTQVLGDGQTFDEVCALATEAQDANGEGRFDVVFYDTPTSASYIVLDTDYATYTAIYSCDEALGQIVELAWILTRDQFPDPSVVETARQAYIDNGLDVDRFVVKAQTIGDADCIYDAPDDFDSCVNVYFNDGGDL